MIKLKTIRTLTKGKKNKYEIKRKMTKLKKYYYFFINYFYHYMIKYMVKQFIFL